LSCSLAVLYLCLVILTDSFTGIPVHVLMLSIQAVRGRPRLCAPGTVPCIISSSRQLSCFLMHGVTVVTIIRYKLDDSSQVPTRIGDDILGGRLSDNLCHCWQATPTVHWHRDTVSTKNKDHAGHEEFRGRRSIHLEQFTSPHANRNSLPIDVRLSIDV